METFINRAIKGLKIDINNIELIIKYKEHIICFDIEKICYSEENGIQMNNFSISLLEKENKKDILKTFSINIKLKKKKKKIKNKKNKSYFINNKIK